MDHPYGMHRRGVAVGPPDTRRPTVLRAHRARSVSSLTVLMKFRILSVRKGPRSTTAGVTYASCTNTVEMDWIASFHTSRGNSPKLSTLRSCRERQETLQNTHRRCLCLVPGSRRASTHGWAPWGRLGTGRAVLRMCCMVGVIAL